MLPVAPFLATDGISLGLVQVTSGKETAHPSKIPETIKPTWNKALMLPVAPFLPTDGISLGLVQVTGGKETAHPSKILRLFNLPGTKH